MRHRGLATAGVSVPLKTSANGQQMAQTVRAPDESRMAGPEASTVDT
jgi:hypothetical protein